MVKELEFKLSEYLEKTFEKTFAELIKFYALEKHKKNIKTKKLIKQYRDEFSDLHELEQTAWAEGYLHYTDIIINVPIDWTFYVNDGENDFAFPYFVYDLDIGIYDEGDTIAEDTSIYHRYTERDKALKRGIHKAFKYLEPED